MLSDLYDWLEHLARRTPIAGRLLLAFLGLVRRLVQLLRDVAPTVVRVQGRLEGQAATLIVVGDPGWVTGWVSGLLSEARVERVGRLLILALPSALRRWRREAAFTAVQLGVLSYAVWGRLFDLTLPRYVSSLVRFGPAWPEARTWSKNIRRFRRQGLVYRVTHDPEEVVRFHAHFYRPTIRSRHGPGAPLLREATLRYWVARGGLLLVGREDGIGGIDPLGGVVFELEGRRLTATVMGLAEGDSALYREGVGLALYFYLLTWARQQGLAEVDLGGSAPVLTSPHLVFKNRWGADLAPSRDAPQRVGLAVAREGAPREVFCRLLATAPLIFERGRGFGALRCLTRRPASPDGPEPVRSLGLAGLVDLDCSPGAGAGFPCPLAPASERVGTCRRTWRNLSHLGESSRDA